ncbi:NAD(P)-dependent alcohol dehydrogenase [Catenulispora yoronensis]|uniref:NAD(P)-dependent alcohol dehydrogenase n=1 Tax=Catenulispora yoronensis TaxID=450799 RepID=A0ABP5F5D1_9ACTN
MQRAYGPVDVLAVRDVERPRPRPDEVVVRVAAAGVGPEVWHVMAGSPFVVRLVFGLRRPRNPVCGRDLAGWVEELGSDVTAFRIGDAVLGSGVGTFAEYARAKAVHLARKPLSITFEQAAALPVSGQTALQALRDKARVNAGQRVLILGASGGVGTYAVQLAAAHFGAEVTAVCGSAAAEHVRALGAAHVVDYTREDIDSVDHVGRYDVILDIAGNRPLPVLRRALTPRGTLVIVGGEGGGKILGMGRALRAVSQSPFLRQEQKNLLALTRASDLATLIGLIEAGQLTPYVDRAYPLADAAAAIRHLREGHPMGKLVVTLP